MVPSGIPRAPSLKRHEQIRGEPIEQRFVSRPQRRKQLLSPVRFTFAATNSRYRNISSGGISRGATIASAAGATDLVVPVAIDTEKI